MHITTIFGTLHATDVFFFENHIKEELTSFATFRDFISRNSLNYDILAKIPHHISDIRYTYRHVEIYQHHRRYTHVQRLGDLPLGAILHPIP